MEAYTLDWQKGQLIQDRMQEADYKRISDKKIDDTMKVQIMNLKEYEQIKEYIPHKKNLLYSMNHVRYCKVDSFHDCVQGCSYLAFACISRLFILWRKQIRFNFLWNM